MQTGEMPELSSLHQAHQPHHQITLTWKDVWVTASADGQKRHLLHGITGYAEPGHIVAIMGPSGSGKSTLLDALAGRLPTNVRHTGKILVNGVRQLLTYGNSAYVTGDDVLIGTLTVREAVHYSAQLQLPKDMSMEEKKERAQRTIQDMGLQDSVDARIGGWRARGLSGGERRRVSIAIQLLTRPYLLFLDEPTSGLDSAAAFHTVKRLKCLALEGRTIIASIHQPSSEVFELFDFLYLLSSGKTIYFGTTLQAHEFFSLNGFPCPSLRDPSDHYLRIINKDFNSEDVEAGAQNTLKADLVIGLLARSYMDTRMEQVVEYVDTLSKQDGPLLQAAPNRSSFSTQVNILTIRSLKNMNRDLGYYWFRLCVYVALSLCIGTVYYKVGTGYSAIQARSCAIMFLSTVFTFTSISGFPAFLEDLKVFERERLNGHYGVASFVVASTVSSAPYLFLISAFPGTLAYLLADFHHGFMHFLYFILTLYSCMLLAEGLMMVIASIVPDFHLAVAVGAGIQGIFILTCGFFRLPNDIPKPVWRYPVHYVAFLSYANEGLYKNDFPGLTFDSNIPGAPRITGEAILKDVFQVKSFSKWVDLLILFGMALLYRLFFFAITKLREKFASKISNMFARRCNAHGDDL